MGKISLQKSNKYLGRRAIGLREILAGVVAFLIVGTSMVLSGCGFTETAHASTNPPVATTTPKPSPTNQTPETSFEPSAKVSDTPVPELSLEEEIKLLEIKKPDDTANVSTFMLAIYTTGEKNKNETIHVSPVFFNYSLEGSKKIWKFYDNNTEELLFSCETSSDIDGPTDVFLLNPETNSDLPGLQNMGLIFITGIDEVNFDYIERTYGIKLNITDWVREISALSDAQRQNHEESIYDYAKHYIEMVPKSLRTNANSFKTAEVVETPSAEPTSIRYRNPSVSYLMGERDIDTEFELGNKVKRM